MFALRALRCISTFHDGIYISLLYVLLLFCRARVQWNMQHILSISYMLCRTTDRARGGMQLFDKLRSEFALWANFQPLDCVQLLFTFHVTFFCTRCKLSQLGVIKTPDPEWVFISSRLVHAEIWRTCFSSPSFKWARVKGRLCTSVWTEVETRTLFSFQLTCYGDGSLSWHNGNLQWCIIKCWLFAQAIWRWLYQAKHC